MENRSKRLEILLESIGDEQGFVALCQYVTNYEVDFSKIQYLRGRYTDSPKVAHIEMLWRRRFEMSKKILELSVLEAKCFNYMQNLDEQLKTISVKDAFKVVKQLQTEFEDTHAEIIEKAQIDGICPLHLKKMKYLLDILHGYYDEVITRLITKNERNFT